MLLRGLIVALLIPHGALAAQAAGLVPQRANDAVTARVVADTKRFFRAWTDAWQRSEEDRHEFLAPSSSVSNSGTGAEVCCHPDVWRVGRNPASGPLIMSANSAFSVCPSWQSHAFEGDERLDLDAALTPARRGAIQATRLALVATLDSAVRQRPSDGWLTGQLVRFLVDARLTDRALTVAQDCRADSWWCAALGGYVHAARDELAAADRAYAVAMRGLPDESRCAWTDVAPLLEDGVRGRYRRLSCLERDAVASRLWWLADPLWSEPGNERRVEHYTRRVLLALRMALGEDERYDWRREYGSDAREELVLRYGWPTYVFWGGTALDKDHSGWLYNRFGARSNEPYTAYEYSPGRVHLVPAWRAVVDPFSAVASDWAIAQLVPGTDAVWPAEHYKPPYALARLGEHQAALLRREHQTLLGVAVEIPARPLERGVGETIDGAMLVVTHQPDSVQRVASGPAIVGRPLVLSGLVDALPALVGVEVPRTGRFTPAGRTRFVVTPPPTLASMALGERAISDPVLLRTSPLARTAPNEPDAALAQMVATARFARGERFGVYWETYGFDPADTVDVALWIERVAPQGFLRDLGALLSITTNRNTPVAIVWREPVPTHSSHVIAGRIPIVARGVWVESSSMPPGEYWLDVAVGQPGHAAVRSRTRVVIY